MRELNQWEQLVRDTIKDSKKFYFLESFYEQLKAIKEHFGIECSYRIFDLMCRYAFYGEVEEDEMFKGERCLFNNSIRDDIDIGKEMIADRERSQKLKYSNDGYVYIIKLNGYYKIGRTTNPNKRFGEYTRLMEQPITICCVYVKNYKQVEKTLHRMFEDKNSNGEWFTLSVEDLSNAIKYIKEREIKKAKQSA